MQKLSERPVWAPLPRSKSKTRVSLSRTLFHVSEKKGSRVLNPIYSPPLIATALSSSIAPLRRILRVSASSSPLKWNLPFSQNRRSSSFLDDKSSGDSNLPPLTAPKLFVSGLSRLTTDEKLRQAFEGYGQLVEAKVITDRISGRSKGFGFVAYATIEEAEKARTGMNAKFLDGWVIFCDPAKPREPRLPPPPQQQPMDTGVRTNKTIGWCG